MRINRVDVRNFMKRKEFNADLAPLSLIVGPNFSGKSSLRDAIDFAFTGTPGRAESTKNYSELVHRGQPNGMVCICIDGGEIVQRDVANGGVVGRLPLLPPSLPCVLRADEFARTLKPDDRRTFLYRLMGIATGPEEIVKRLRARNLPKEKVDQIAPLLHGGFERALKEATQLRVKAKDAWEEVTGERFGPTKTWTAALPPFTQAELDQAIDDAKGWMLEIERLNQLVGQLDAIKKEKAEVPELRKKGATYSGWAERERDLEADRNVLKQQLLKLPTQAAPNAESAAPQQTLLKNNDHPSQDIQQVAVHSSKDHLFAVCCPKCHADINVDLRRGIVELAPEPSFPVEKQDVASSAAAADPHAAERQEILRKMTENNVALVRARELKAEAEEAIRRADRIEAREIPADLLCASQSLHEARDQHANAQADQRRLDIAKRSREEAQKKTDRAAILHADAMVWDAMVKALSPDGLPSEILSEALGPFQRLLLEASVATGWDVVEISPEMQITAGGFRYSLLSESMQWRVDAIIAVAIAILSGLKLVLLDRFDRLDGNGREEALCWLWDLIQKKTLDSVLVFGTMPRKPEGLPEHCAAFWIGDAE